jgi:transcriptional regulator with XRE-family HTH domain
MPGPWGIAITKLRVLKGLTKEAVAKRAKMTPTTYGRIERGHHTQTRKLQDIADVFAVDIAEVLLPQSEPLTDAYWRQVRDTVRVLRSLESTPKAAEPTLEDAATVAGRAIDVAKARRGHTTKQSRRAGHKK